MATLIPSRFPLPPAARARRRLALLGLALLAVTGFAKPRVTIAAASNLVFVLEPLQRGFVDEAGDVDVEVISGSSGNLLAQLVHGAPYDLYLPADLDHARRAIAAGVADADSLRVFAVGRLVLLTTRGDIPMNAISEVVRDPRVRRIAIANPAHAPYGRAAEQVLQALQLHAEARPKLVLGENLTQAAQFVEAGGADAGFVALSVVRGTHLRERGRWIAVPPDLHAPLEQAALLTKRAAGNDRARQFLAYLHSDAARAVLQAAGYQEPRTTQTPRKE